MTARVRCWCRSGRVQELQGLQSVYGVDAGQQGGGADVVTGDRIGERWIV